MRAFIAPDSGMPVPNHRYDVFNGDADGICALLQLRLQDDERARRRLVTGVKRDIRLLEKIQVRPRDRDHGARYLARFEPRRPRAGAGGRRAEVTLVRSPLRRRDPGARGCWPSSILRPGCARACWWTATLAARSTPGPSSAPSATTSKRRPAASREADFDAGQAKRCCALGEALNHNAYGESVADLRYPPAELYRHAEAVSPARSPSSPRRRPSRNCARAIARTCALPRTLRPVLAEEGGLVFVLPDTAWARRVSGVFANRLDDGAHAERAIAVLTSRRRAAASWSACARRRRGPTAPTRCAASSRAAAAESRRRHQPPAGEADYERFVAALPRRVGREVLDAIPRYAGAGFSLRHSGAVTPECLSPGRNPGFFNRRPGPRPAPG
jgi:hypothetical protein